MVAVYDVLAQKSRVPACHAGGSEIKTRRSRHILEENMENWKPYIYNYDVSDMGRVRNRVTNHILRQRRTVGGYHICVVSCGSRENKVAIRVHDAVATLFLENPNHLPQVNHKDGNKDNNAVENLEWCTCGDNIRHAFEHGLNKPRRCDKAPSAKLKPSDVQFIRTYYIPRDKEFGARALAKKYGVSHRSINRIIHGVTWTDLQTSTA